MSRKLTWGRCFTAWLFGGKSLQSNLGNSNGLSFPISAILTSVVSPNTFDCKEIIFVKRILQTVLPEKLRNQISSDLFEKYVGVSEEQLAYELYMTEEQIRTMKRHGMFIGLHGYDHYWLGNLNETEMRQDVDRALEAMDAVFPEELFAGCVLQK